MVNARRDNNNIPSIQGLDGNVLRNVLVDNEGKIILTSSTKNTSYTDRDETSVLDDNRSPSLIGVTPTGKIRRLKTDSSGKLKFVIK